MAASLALPLVKRRNTSTLSCHRPNLASCLPCVSFPFGLNNMPVPMAILTLCFRLNHRPRRTFLQGTAALMVLPSFQAFAQDDIKAAAREAYIYTYPLVKNYLTSRAGRRPI